MLRQIIKGEKKAQTYLEYTLVIGAVILIMFTMSTMLKRGTQAMIFVVADRLGNQVNADQRFESGSFLEKSFTSTRATADKTTYEIVDRTGYQFGDIIETYTNSVSNLGFTNEN